MLLLEQDTNKKGQVVENATQLKFEADNNEKYKSKIFKIVQFMQKSQTLATY